ncbi:MAG TPA: NAD(P)H-dependent oxidoreductase [Candidatus Gracilibacteria bacterium]
MNSIISDLQWRYATKQFDPEKKISDQDFQTLLEALILTPSSYGLQPWKFVVVQDPELRAKLVPHSWNQRQIVEASHLIVLCRLQNIDEKYIDHYVQTIAQKRTAHAKGTDHDQALKAMMESLGSYKEMMVGGVLKGMDDTSRAQWAEKQVYIALGNLMTVAATMHIDACPMEGFDPQKYDEILGLKAKGLHAVVICPVGYRSKDDKYAHLAKVRFEASQLVETL